MKALRRAATKPWIVMPLVALVALGGWTAWHANADSGADAGAAGVGPAEQVIEATVGSMAETVSAEGTIEPENSDQLSFTAAGTVTGVNVVAGQQVTAGQVLATLDSPELESNLADAQSSLADAEARLADDEDADASESQLEADRSAVTAAQDQVTNAYEAMAGLQLVASFDGTVSAINITAGEELGSGGASGTSTTGSGSGSGQTAGGLGSGGGGTLSGGTQDTTSTSTETHIEVVSTDRFTVQVGFDDADIDKLAAGQVATVALSASSANNPFAGGPFAIGGGGFPNFGGNGTPAPGAGTDQQGDGGTADTNTDVATVSGSVVEVGQVADASSGVASYPVTIAFQDVTGDYHAGATVSVDITYDQRDNVVQVPAFAVTTTDGQSTVTVRTADGDETRPVTTGLTAGNMVEIVSGLQVGEQVVVDFAARFGTGGPPAGTGGGAGQFQPPAQTGG